MERSYLPTPQGDISFIERKGSYPVIFLHGLGGSGNNWLKLSQYLPESYDLIMPDLGGHGRTKSTLVDYSIAEQVELVKLFIESKGIGEFALVGNSYGGWVSMRFCASGGKPSHLVLIDSAGINPTVGEYSAEGEIKFVERVMAMNPKNDPEIIRRFVRRNASGTEKLKDEDFEHMPENTLIIWGQKDRLIPVEFAEKLNHSIKGSSLRIIEDAGHIPHSTHPAVVASFLTEFIRI